MVRGSSSIRARIRGGREVNSLPRRVLSRLRRELALLLARGRWPAVEFGSRCDIRRGLYIVRFPGARVSFGERCVLDRHLTIECAGELIVGAGTIFGHHCTVGAKESIRIGPDCLIAEMVSIRDSDHVFAAVDRPYRDQGHASAPVVLGKNVWLGSKVVVARGVQIGDNAVIGAGAVVTKDVPSNCLAVGVPARVVRMLGTDPEP
jgi:acetyltransferase-like isoleucine patch superfamily enzyme